MGDLQGGPGGLKTRVPRGGSRGPKTANLPLATFWLDCLGLPRQICLNWLHFAKVILGKIRQFEGAQGGPRGSVGTDREIGGQKS